MKDRATSRTTRGSTLDKVDLLVDMLAEHCISGFTDRFCDLPDPDEIRALADLIRSICGWA